NLKIELVKDNGPKEILKDNLKVIEGEIIDATTMSKKALISFLDNQIADAKDQDVLFSLHMKATMMKVSDPIIFGHAVKIFFKDLFLKHESLFKEVGVEENNGFGNIIDKLENLPVNKRTEIEADIKNIFENRPKLAMVNSDKDITNLHVPSDTIIDASMPAMIRNSGQMWNAGVKSHDTKAVIPDSSYAGVYSATIDFCKEHGAF